MFGVYDILETVGQGGMGVVYRAQDTALDRIVALKVLKEDLRQSKQIAARFQREAEAIASLNHPNIVHIYSVGAVGRIPYIAMEFITGAPLSAVMKRQKSIPWKRALHIAEQVAEALACAHEAHIIHRDIKPGNILIGANDRAYVTDFGIAKVLTAETQLTVEGSRLGTPHYMSPERCSKGDITLSSDLYSLGVVLFQMLSGRLPYEASSPVDLIRKIVASPPARLSEIAPDLPGDVERLVAYLIEKKPVNRPKSAADVARMCRRVIEGEPLFEDDGVAASLKDFRENQQTPSTTSTHIDSAFGEARGLFSRVGHAWRHLSPAAQLWSAGVVLIAAMALLGQWTAQKSYGGYALTTVSRWDQSTAAWTAVTSPAEWVRETEGVNLARLEFLHYRAEKAVAVGAQQFAVEITQASSVATLIVDGIAQTVRVALPPSAHEGNPARVVGGGAAGDTSFFYLSRARRASGVVVPAILKMDSARLDDPAGVPVLFPDDLEDAVGAAITEVVKIATPGDGTIYAVSVRAEGLAGEHLVQVETTGSAPVVTPLLLGVSAISAMAYDEAGNLYVAQQSASGWSAVRFRAGMAARQPDMLYELGSAGGEIGQVRSDGALVRIAGTNNTFSFEWHAFGSGDAWIVGTGTAAAVLLASQEALITAPDRRGNVQLWRVPRAAPDEPVQLTFLDDGIAPEFAVSHDGRYALGRAAGAEPPTLVLVSLDLAGDGE